MITNISNKEIKAKIRFPHLYDRTGKFRSKYMGNGFDEGNNQNGDFMYLRAKFDEKRRPRCRSVPCPLSTMPKKQESNGLFSDEEKDSEPESEDL